MCSSDLCVTVDAEAREAVIDFTGTVAQWCRTRETITRRLRCVRPWSIGVSHLGRGGYSAKSGVLETTEYYRSCGHHAELRLSGGGDSGQYRGQPSDVQCFVWRAGCDRLFASHHEQFHLRQRGVSEL